MKGYLQENMNYYKEIKENLIKSEIYDRTKDYAKDKNKVMVYYEVGKKYNERTLYNMRKFFELFNKQKLNPLGSKLSWSHYREILSLKNANEIKYYIDVCEKRNLSKRELQAIMKNHEYDRLSEETKTKIIESKPLNIKDIIPNPIILKSNNTNERLSEYALKQIILNN